MKRKIFVIIFGFLLVLKSLDWFLFDYLYFKFPNEMEWDTSPWYNFLDYTKKIQFDESETGVLLVGSSVALYSTLPEQIQTPEDNENNHGFRSDLYSHVAMAPTDLQYYLDDIISKKPKIVVYVFNPADFQMEYISDGLNHYDFPSWLEHFSWRHPARLLYPNRFAWDYFSDLTRNQIYRLWGKGFLYINRYREFFWDPIFAYMERHYRRGRSFHIYTGSEPKEGIWQHGWTLPGFTIACDASLGFWKDSVYIPQPNTALTIYPVDTDGRRIGENLVVNFSKTGWHNLHIDFSHWNLEPADSVDLRMEVSQDFSSRFAENKPYGKEYNYGIRLSQNFCTQARGRDFSYKRPKFLEESRFRNMSLDEYKLDYYERIYRDNENRPELTRMKTLSDKKEMIAETDFQPWLEIERFRDIQQRLEKESILFLLVLSPENPIELKKYRNSRWYYGMLDYLGALSEGHFYDYSGFLKDPRYFSDPHHLTYEGAQKFSQEIKEMITREIAQGEGHD